MAEGPDQGAAQWSRRQQIMATDVVPERRTYMQTTYGITASADNKHAVQESTVVVLAVKPRIMPMILEEIAPVVNSEKLVISIAAGITLQTLQRALGDSRVVRVMPNTPALVLAGAAGISPGKAATAGHCPGRADFQCRGARHGGERRDDGRGYGPQWQWSSVHFCPHRRALRRWCADGLGTPDGDPLSGANRARGRKWSWRPANTPS